MHIVEPGKHGLGIKIQAGDTLRVPPAWLQVSADPLKGVGHLTRHGLQWFAKLIFMESFSKDHKGIKDELQKLIDRCDKVLRESALLADYDTDTEDEEQGDEIVNLLRKDQSTAEWWACMSGMFANWAKDAMSDGDIDRAVWAAVGAERSRSMLVFKESLETVVWMGHSAKKIVEILGVWDNNKMNSDEGFWQTKFNENSYVLSQVFASPMIFMKDKASIAGMNIDSKGAKFVDYLYSMESSREAIAIEIKTPATPLLGKGKYRGIYPPSRDLGGAVVQVLDYRRNLTTKMQTLVEGTDYEIEAFDPKCALIIGNGKVQLQDSERRKSFELFRAAQKDVEIITYDELFRKVDILASLFSLTHKTNQSKKS